DQRLGVLAEFGVQYLDRDPGILVLRLDLALVAGLEHDAHAAAAHFLVQVEAVLEDVAGVHFAFGAAGGRHPLPRRRVRTALAAGRGVARTGRRLGGLESGRRRRFAAHLGLFVFG